jgi:hypothetical protein
MADVRSDEPGVWIGRTAEVTIKILTDIFVCNQAEIEMELMSVRSNDIDMPRCEQVD